MKMRNSYPFYTPKSDPDPWGLDVHPKERENHRGEWNCNLGEIISLFLKIYFRYLKGTL